MFFNPLFFDLIRQLNGLFPVTKADSNSPTPASIIPSKSQPLLSINDGLNDQKRNKNQHHEQTLESSLTVDSSKIVDSIVGDNEDLIFASKKRPNQTSTILRGGDSNGSSIYGSKEDDYILGLHGYENYIQGFQGNDSIAGRNLDDTINGGDGDDTMEGGSGADSFISSGGNNIINDFQLKEGDLYLLNPSQIHGTLSQAVRQDGNDVILKKNNGTTKFLNTFVSDVSQGLAIRHMGSSGDDTIKGSEFNDIISGGFGADTFVLSAGTDRIRDFSPNEGDRFTLDQAISNKPIGFSLEQSGDDVLVKTSEGVTRFMNSNIDDVSDHFIQSLRKKTFTREVDSHGGSYFKEQLVDPDAMDYITKTYYGKTSIANQEGVYHKFRDYQPNQSKTNDRQWAQVKSQWNDGDIETKYVELPPGWGVAGEYNGHTILAGSKGENFYVGEFVEGDTVSLTSKSWF